MTKQEYFDSKGFRGFKPIPNGADELDEDFKNNVDALVLLFEDTQEDDADI